MDTDIWRVNADTLLLVEGDMCQQDDLVLGVVLLQR